MEKRLVKVTYFQKFRNWIRNLFVHKEIVKEKSVKNENLRENISIHKDDEILKLQKDLEDKKISICEISTEDLRKINNLYDKQIEQLRTQISQNKKEIKYYYNEFIKIKKQNNE